MHFSLTFVVELMKQVPVLLCTEYIFQCLYLNINVLSPFSWKENNTSSLNMEAAYFSEMLVTLF